MDDETIDEVLSELEEELAPAVTVAWVMVADVVDAEGWRYICHRKSEELTTWQRNGMLHEVLYGDWEVNDGD